ncbi:MAG: anaerobic ribonucleoside-triphosphate reductase [Cyanobacteria bacterium REEB65]|nr:anaerobic ribonucleoside-triphosphate reductase [Cyanobacteria bacterium REEB65]
MSTVAVEQIRKRDGRVVPFDPGKIERAIARAVRSVQQADDQLVSRLAGAVCLRVEAEAPPEPAVPSVELVQDAIERALLETGNTRIARSYILYRARRNRIREAKSELMEAVEEILREGDVEGIAACRTPSVKMLEVGAAASREYYLKRFIPEEAADAHIRGDLHIHDIEHYAKTFNSFQIPVSRLLTEGFTTAFGSVRPAKRPASAMGLCALALQQAQNECFGGQSFSALDRDLARVLGPNVDEGELQQALEGFIYDLNTLHSRAGGQVPYSSVAIGLETSPVGRMVSRAILKAFMKGLGRGEPALYPNLTFKIQAGTNFEPESPNHDLYQLALEVAAHRMLPNFAFVDAPANAACGAEITYLSGCARIGVDRHEAPLDSGRGNLATVSINLPRIVLKARRGSLAVGKLLETQLQIAGRQLLHRVDALGRLKARDLPFVMGQGLYAGSGELTPDDPIASALRHGTLAIAFVGLAEALLLLEGQHHGSSDRANERGLALVRQMREFTDALSEQHDRNFALYGSHADAPARRFAALDRRDFGVIEGVTDKPWYTSSFHLPADFSVAVSDLLRIEAPYHELCNAGHLTVVELSGPPEIPAVDRLLRQMREGGIAYGGISFPLDHCATCRVAGTFPDGCPECGAPAPQLIRVRRHAGYLSPIATFSAAKRAELAARVPTEI